MHRDEFSIGDRVKGVYNSDKKTFTGTVVKIDNDGSDYVDVERDDGLTGTGIFVDGKQTWRCRIANGHIRSNGIAGEKLMLLNSIGGKMKLEDIKKENLKEAKKQVDSDKANAEIAFARTELKRAIDEIDRLDREIKAKEEAKKPYLEIIEKFK